MPLLLKAVEPGRGARWVSDAYRLYARRPFAFTSLFVVYMAVVGLVLPLLMALTGLGQLAFAVQAVLVPTLSLGFMVASQSALLDGRVRPSHFLEPFRGDNRRRKALLLLCALYGGLAVGLLMLGNAVSGGGLLRLFQLASTPDAPQAELAALLADTSVTAAVLLCALLFSLLTVPFWHAPALVHWGDQGVGQALFSSTLAVWRAKGAFFVYAMTWVMLVLGSSLLFAVLGALVGGRLVPLMALGAGLFFSTLFYVSLLFTFNDSFGNAGEARATAAADPAP